MPRRALSCHCTQELEWTGEALRDAEPLLLQPTADGYVASIRYRPARGKAQVVKIRQGSRIWVE